MPAYVTSWGDLETTSGAGAGAGQLVIRNVQGTFPTQSDSFFNAGTNVTGTFDHGSSTTGGVDFDFADVSASGTVDSIYSATDRESLTATITDNVGVFGSDPVQYWNLEFDGTFTDSIDLTFGYDDANLLFPEDELDVVRHTGSSVSSLTKVGQDVAANTITVRSTSLSNFILVPEPSTLVLLVLGGMLAFVGRWRKE